MNETSRGQVEALAAKDGSIYRHRRLGGMLNFYNTKRLDVIARVFG